VAVEEGLPVVVVAAEQQEAVAEEVQKVVAAAGKAGKKPRVAVGNSRPPTCLPRPSTAHPEGPQAL